MSFYNERNVKSTRKKHQCHGCLEIIEVGSKAVYNSGVFEGDFFSCYYCTDCDNYIKDNIELFKGGVIYPGDVKETKKERSI